MGARSEECEKKKGDEKVEMVTNAGSFIISTAF
jgi:hypothetical protein